MEKQATKRPLKRRYFLLLEVMIALAIIALAVLPLISPHFYIYSQQKKFVHKLDLDVAINHFYAHIIEKLQRNEINFQDIEQKVKFPLDIRAIKDLNIKNFPFQGTYHLAIHKVKKNANFGLYQVLLAIEVLPQEPLKGARAKPLKYEYLIFVSRLFKGESSATNEPETSLQDKGGANDPKGRPRPP